MNPGAAPALTLLAALVPAAVRAGEIERAEDLLSVYYLEDAGVLSGSELLELARRPAVREWMRKGP